MSPCDINGIHKMASEMYYQLYHRMYGVRTAILRLTGVYGPRMVVRNNLQTSLGWLIRQVLDGDEIQVFGEGEQLRDFVYVDDVVDALLRAGASPGADGEVFNIGGSDVVSFLALTRLLIEVAGKGRYRKVAFPGERERIDVGSVYLDSSKAASVLGWRPAVTLAKGLEHTLDFYRRHGEHYW